MKGRLFKKTLSGCLALLLVSGGVPLQPIAQWFKGADITAHADSEWSKFTASNTTLGTSGIGSPNAQNTDSAWQGSYVYYGQYNNQPVKYRVLDPNSNAFGVNGGSLFLDCDTTLFNSKFDDSSIEWADSYIRSYLGNVFYSNSFNYAEKAAIAASKTNIAYDQAYFLELINTLFYRLNLCLKMIMY